MAPISPDATTRYFIKYTVNTRTHTVMIRVDTTISPGDVSEAFGSFIEALEPALYSSTFVAMERSAIGSNVRVPAAYSGPMEWGTGSGAEKDAPQFVSFTGKDIDGVRFRVEMFGRIGELHNNARIAEIDSTVVSNTLTALEESSFIWLTVNNKSPILNRYMNESISQHWIGELRH